MVLRRAIPLALGLFYSASLVVGPSRADDPPRRPAAGPFRQSPRRQGLKVPPRNAVAKDKKPVPPGPAPAPPELPAGLLPELELPEPDSIKPTPLVAIPDNPPPHEGAMFDLPIVIDPPDLLLCRGYRSAPGTAYFRRAIGPSRRDDQPWLLWTPLRQGTHPSSGQGEADPPPSQVPARRCTGTGRRRGKVCHERAPGLEPGVCGCGHVQQHVLLR